MPAWLMRLLWKTRGKRRVRLQMLDDSLPTFEGVRLGRWGGCYVLMQARLIHADGSTNVLDGVTEVPVERVFFAQVLS